MTKGLCKICGKEKRIFYYGLCESCYRKEIIEKYNHKKLKPEIKSIDHAKTEKHRQILRLVLLKDRNFKETARILKIPARTVSWVVDKYCYKCDENGNPKPQEYLPKPRKEIK